MTSKRKIAAIASVAVLAAAGGTTYAVAEGGDDDGPEPTGPAADRARAAALALFPGGRANSVERDSEDGATWEVEMTRRDGATVDVRLDEAYGVVVVEGDTEDETDDQ